MSVAAPSTEDLAEYVRQRATGKRFARLPDSIGMYVVYVLAAAGALALLLLVGILGLIATSDPPPKISGSFYATTAQVLPVFYFALVVSPALRGRRGSMGTDAATITAMTFSTACGTAASLSVLADGNVHSVTAWRLVLIAMVFIGLAMELELIVNVTTRFRRHAQPAWPTTAS